MILLYKSPGDHLDVDTYYKATAYGCLYKAYADTVNGRKAEDLTITLLRDTRPDGLFRNFKQAGASIGNAYDGIYYLYGKEILFPTQVIVTKELAGDHHAFLRMLTEQPQKQDLSRFLKIANALEGKADKEFAESILDVFAAANRKWMEQWKGDNDMSSALLEIMAPELQKAEDKGRREGTREGIRGTVNVLYNLGFEKKEIKEAVMKQYGLSETEMAQYL